MNNEYSVSVGKNYCMPESFYSKKNVNLMIDAYYSRGCDSSDLFDDTEIAKSSDYRKYMNQYHVIHLDISTFWDSYKDNIVEKLIEYVYKDFKEVFEDQFDYEDSLSYTIMSIYQKTNTPFVIIIDEWDCVIRNSEDQKLIHKYLQFLHSLFKSEESKSKPITKYYGFTEEEVKGLCERFDMDFDTTKAWYNGYTIGKEHMYNPNSVVQSMMDLDFDSYWKNTSSFSSINTFTTMNYEVAKAFQMALKNGAWSEIAKAISRCDELLMATIDKDSEKVAGIIEQYKN